MTYLVETDNSLVVNLVIPSNDMHSKLTMYGTRLTCLSSAVQYQVRFIQLKSLSIMYENES